MARREDHHHQQQQRQIHYATIMPSNGNTTMTNGNGLNASPTMRKQTELERAKAVREFFILKKSYRFIKSPLEKKKERKKYVCSIILNDEIISVLRMKKKSFYVLLSYCFKND
jgi:hypothetical protein